MKININNEEDILSITQKYPEALKSLLASMTPENYEKYKYLIRANNSGLWNLKN